MQLFLLGALASSGLGEEPEYWVWLRWSWNSAGGCKLEASGTFGSQAWSEKFLSIRGQTVFQEIFRRLTQHRAGTWKAKLKDFSTEKKMIRIWDLPVGWALAEHSVLSVKARSYQRWIIPYCNCKRCLVFEIKKQTKLPRKKTLRTDGFTAVIPNI